MMNRLETKLHNLSLQNPVTVASGTFGTSDEYASFVDYNKLGGIITKTITNEPWQGNPMPRIAEVTSGMLNSIGLQNAGVVDFIEKKIPYFEDITTALIVSIGGHCLEDYVAVAKKLQSQKRVDAIEVNVSCPNVEGGLDFTMDPNATKKLASEISQVFDRTIIFKLSPESPLTKITEGAILGGAHAVNVMNTIRGMAVDIKTKKPKLWKTIGGFSGPAVKPIALRCVHEVRREFDIPIIATGGISTTEDALEFLIVGATVVSLGTINYVFPNRSQQIAEELQTYCEENNLSSIDEIRGTLELYQ